MRRSNIENNLHNRYNYVFFFIQTLNILFPILVLISSTIYYYIIWNLCNTILLPTSLPFFYCYNYLKLTNQYLTVTTTFLPLPLSYHYCTLFITFIHYYLNTTFLPLHCNKSLICKYILQLVYLIATTTCLSLYTTKILKAT